MGTPYLGQISITGFNFAPRGWAMCNGQLLSIAQNTALFSLLGTYYGGNGIQNFALPDLRGRTPTNVGQGPGLSNYVTGEQVGVESVTLLTTQIPSHSHSLAMGTTTASVPSPSGAILAMPKLNSSGASVNAYASAAGGMVPMATPIGTTGSSQPHNNLSPYLCLNFIIALTGIFPSRN